MEQVWYSAAAWVELALLASLISIRLGISIALMEIFPGLVAGNLATLLHTAISQLMPLIAIAGLPLRSASLPRGGSLLPDRS